MGVVGGGGLGYLAMNEGYHNFNYVYVDYYYHFYHHSPSCAKPRTLAGETTRPRGRI